MTTDLFSASNNSEHISLTEQLLKKLDDFVPENGTEQFCEDLKTVINFHDHTYYVKADSIITDYDYDRLFKKLKEVETAYPNFITADSPYTTSCKRIKSGISNRSAFGTNDVIGKLL
jgi:DNA ligase (NAD+)